MSTFKKKKDLRVRTLTAQKVTKVLMVLLINLIRIGEVRIHLH